MYLTNGRLCYTYHGRTSPSQVMVYYIAVTAPQHMGLAALGSYAKLQRFRGSMRRLFPDFLPHSFPPSSQKGPILAPRPLSPKCVSLNLLWVMVRGICGTLSPSIHRLRFLTRAPSLSLGVYFLSSRTRVFNHEHNITVIPPYLSASALDGSRKPRRDVGKFRQLNQRPPNYKPKTTKIMAWAKSL